MFVTGFIGYFTVTAPDVQISPLKRYVYICFVSISIVLTAFDMFDLGWLGLADFGSIDLMNVFLFFYCTLSGPFFRNKTMRDWK